MKIKLALPLALLMLVVTVGCKKDDTTFDAEDQQDVAEAISAGQVGGYNLPDNLPEIAPVVEGNGEDLLVTKMEGEGTQPSPMPEDDVMIQEGELSLTLVSPQVLVDVSGGVAGGESRTALEGDVTYHSILASNMPELTNDDFYEGWLVRDAAKGEFFSTGELTQGENGDYNLFYAHDGDVADYTKVVVTLEPRDGDPAPAAHIIEN